MAQDWQTLAAQKRASNNDKIPQEWRLPAQLLEGINQTSDRNVLSIPTSSGILSPRELEITESQDATALLQQLAAGTYTAVEVTTAFCKRAAIAQQLVNCLTEIMFDDALARARQLDEYFQKNGRIMGPLHGLPISLKDSFNVKGYQSTIGYVAFLSHPPAQGNSALVEILISNGAIPYVKTNLPQTMMTADSENNVFGRTLNPNKLSLTAGGSTGGEGALIAMRGSLLGACTDVAGSVRIPALCNGIYGYKPTAQRTPFFGKTPPGRLGSPSAIPPVIGPEAHSIRDMALFMKTVIDSQPWLLDDGVINVPWRTTMLEQRPLRLGLVMETPKRPLHPAILRTIRTTASILKSAGHEVIDITVQTPDLYETSVLAMKYFLLDPKKTPVSYIESAGEPWVASIKTATFPEVQGYTSSLDQLFDMNVERKKIVRTYHDVLVKERLDGFIMPCYSATAVPHDTYGAFPYSVLANMLDYPAVQIPFMKADEQLDAPFVRPDAAYEPPYDARAVEGAPSGFQIVGIPMRDEELLQMAEIVVNILQTSSL